MMPSMQWYCARCGSRAEQAGACARDGEPLCERDGLLGSVAGNYTCVGRLGEGGMGEVLRGVNPVIGTQVAIKVLRNLSSQSKVDAARFVLEASAANRIEDDRIVKIMDGGRLDTGQPYLVMELLEGESLAAAIARGPLGVERALEILDEVLGAVAAAHAARIVHRDLKPENVFLTRSTRVRLLDFGVAKLLDDTDSGTRTGAMVGTPHYMAPEQIQGGQVDGRSDLYATGVILYELLAGRRPFDGPTPFAIVQAHVSAPIPRLPEACAPHLHDVVTRALAKRPEERFATAEEMRAALRAGPAQVSASPPPVAPARGARRWAIASLAALLAIAAIVTGILWTGSSSPPATMPAPVDVATLDAAALDATAVALTSPDAPLVDAMAVAMTSPDAVRPTSSTPRSSRHVPAAVPPDAAAPLQSCKCWVLYESEAREREGRTVPLCSKRKHPRCRCVDSETFQLCLDAWAPCPESGCPDDVPTLGASYCPRLSMGGIPGSACTGFRNPSDPSNEGLLNCECGDVALTYRGHEGEPCTGFDGFSGRERPGKLIDCQ
jgi:serine/threonine-protein kinase